MTANTPADTPKKSPYADIDISWYEVPFPTGIVNKNGEEIFPEVAKYIFEHHPEVVDACVEYQKIFYPNGFDRHPDPYENAMQEKWQNEYSPKIYPKVRAAISYLTELKEFDPGRNIGALLSLITRLIEKGVLG